METLNIRQFKLISGESIIGLVNQNNDNNYIIERPVIVYPNMVGGYQFADWFPFSDQKVYKIDKFNIVGDVSIVKDVQEVYIKYALSKKEIPPFQSHEELMDSLTANVMDRMGIEYEDEPNFETTNTDKETIH